MTLGTRIVVMKDGVIQQVDSPQNLYDRPDNLFVAGFIYLLVRPYKESDTLKVDMKKKAFAK